MIITVDGPTASGKGSLARALAQHTGSHYLDTGSLYRAVGFVISLIYDKQTTRAATFWTPELVAQIVGDLSYVYTDGTPHVSYKGEDITGHLRTPLIDWYASHVSSEVLVRQGLRLFQQKMGEMHDVVVDGRDTGTVIFPHADYKFFLTASLEVRTQRALQDDARKAAHLDHDEMKRLVIARDLRDIVRPIGKLRPADDAIIIDSSAFSSEATVALVLGYLI